MPHVDQTPSERSAAISDNETNNLPVQDVYHSSPNDIVFERLISEFLPTCSYALLFLLGWIFVIFFDHARERRRKRSDTASEENKAKERV